MKFLQILPSSLKEDITEGKIRHFECFLPLPNGRESIKLGEFFYPINEDPRGEEILTLFDKDDLETEIESLEHDAPDTTPEEFWEAYDKCRVNPYELEWQLLSPEASLIALKYQEMAHQNYLDCVPPMDEW